MISTVLKTSAHVACSGIQLTLFRTETFSIPADSDAIFAPFGRTERQRVSGAKSLTNLKQQPWERRTGANDNEAALRSLSTRIQDGLLTGRTIFRN